MHVNHRHADQTLFVNNRMELDLVLALMIIMEIRTKVADPNVFIAQIVQQIKLALEINAWILAPVYVE